MAIPYRTAKFKSANIFANGNLGPNRQTSIPANISGYTVCYLLSVIILYLFKYTEIINQNKSLHATCLNITVSEGADLSVPPPIILYSNDDNVNYLCPNDPTRYYSFTCELYGNDLIWKFNGKSIKSYLANAQKQIGELQTVGKNSAPDTYNISTVLLSIEDTIYGVKCNSSLVVRPITTDREKLIPFSVTCQTYCKQNITLTDSTGQCDFNAVCHRREYYLIGM